MLDSPESQRDRVQPASDLTQAVAALLCADDRQEGLFKTGSEVNDFRFNRKGEVLEERVYDKLVERLQEEGLQVRHRRIVSLESMQWPVVSNTVVTQRSFIKNSRKFTCRTTHAGNAAIVLLQRSEIRFGFINTIWDQSLSGTIRRHVLVTPLKPLSKDDAHRNPFLRERGLACNVVYNLPEADILLGLGNIVSHAAFRVRPAFTFDINQEIVVYHILDRGHTFPLYP